MKKIFPGLDILRFLLAYYIVLFHTLGYYSTANAWAITDVFMFGGYASSTFFILSGFILAHVYIGTSNAEGLKVPVSRFFINKLSTLYPVHIITLLLTIALMFLNPFPYDVNLSGLDAHPIVHTMSTAEVAANGVVQILLLQAWNPFYQAFNVPAWSLSALLFFYLCFPLLAPRLLSMRRKVAMVMVMWAATLLPALIAIKAGWYGVWAIGALHTNPLILLPEFLAGVLAYGIFSAHTDLVTGIATRHLRSAVLLLAALFASSAYLFVNGSPAWKFLLHNGAMLPTQVALVFLSASVLRDASPRVTRWSSRLGNAALSVFALQIPLFTLFLKVSKALEIPYPLRSCFRQIHLCAHAVHGMPPRFSFYPAYLVTLLIASVFFQEKVVAAVRGPLRRMLTNQRATATPGHDALLSDQQGPQSNVPNYGSTTV